MSRPLVRRIHVDTDPGLDDLLALAFAFASPELRIESLTTVAGNASLEHVTDNALRFLTLLGLPDLPLGKGAARPLSLSSCDAVNVHGIDGRGGVELPKAVQVELPDAGAVLRRSLEERRVDCVVALGPLTNVATIVAEDPGAFADVEILWMGGSLCGGNKTPVAEFNCYADPEAADIVMRSGLDVRVVGLDVTNEVVLRRRDVKADAFGDSERGRFLWAVLDALMEVERPMRGEACAVLHDPTAIAAVLGRDLFRWEKKRLRADHSEGEDRGRLSETDRPGGQVDYAVEVNHPELSRLFLERVAAWAGALEPIALPGAG